MDTESSGWGEEVLARIGDGEPAALEEWLVQFAEADEGHREAVADAIASAVRRLALEDEPPGGPDADVWRALVATADRLYGSGAIAMGRLPFVSDALFERLVAEAHELAPEQSDTERRAAAVAGDMLAGLAVSRQLRESVGEAVGFAVVPSYDAVYLYEPPGSHVRTHLDARDYEIVFHLILEHDLPPGGSGGSALVLHLPGQAEPTRLRVKAGEAVVLRGRGTVHSWEPLRDGEWRTLTAVGFERATSSRART